MTRRDIERRLSDLEDEVRDAPGQSGDDGADDPLIIIRHHSADDEGEPIGVRRELRGWFDDDGEWRTHTETYEDEKRPEPVAER